MKIIIARILITAVSVVLLGMILDGVHVQDNWIAILVAIVLALLNATIRPLLIIFTLPVTLFSFGLFLFVINALIIMLASRWVNGFQVDGFWWALLFSFLLALVNTTFQKLLLKGHEVKQPT